MLERGHQYNAKSKFESWLFAIARHLVIDISRRKKFSSLEGLADPESGRPYEPPDDHARSALQLSGDAENERAVQLSLMKIPAYYREVLLLRFHEELGLEEIASVLASPLSTVKSRLYRGLRGVENCFAGRCRMSENVHVRAQQLFERSLVEGLASTDQEWLDGHLRECEGCSRETARARELLRAFRSVPVSVPRDLAARTQLRVRLRRRRLRKLRVAGALLWVITGRQLAARSCQRSVRLALCLRGLVRNSICRSWFWNSGLYSGGRFPR